MELSWVISGGVGGMALIMFLISWRRRRRSPGRRFCPGPKRHWAIRFQPWRLVFRSVCGYDLSGSPGYREGKPTCSECGRALKSRRQMVRSGHRFVVFRAGVGLLFLSIFVPKLVDVNWAEVVRLVPSPPLVAMETMLLDDTPEVVRVELRGRMSNLELEDAEERKMIALLVRDLRMSMLTNSADPAMMLLATCGEQAIADLERTLDAPDHQQRQLAAHLLRLIPTYRPTQRMLEVTLEGLAKDDIPVPRRRTKQPYMLLEVCNAKDGTAYLACHASEAIELLTQGMMSSDEQQRMFAATASGLGGASSLIPAAAPILLEHLRDNDITGDAKIAKFALRGFGPDVRPTLELGLIEADVQARKAIEQVLVLIEHDEQVAAQRELHPLSPLEQAMADARRTDWQSIYLPFLSWHD